MLRAQNAYGKTTSQVDCNGISVGRRLYPTVPEDRFDRGPFEDDRFVGVADVRLDNREELAFALGLSPGKLATRADSTILFAALRAWGAQAPDRLLGDFAFAWFDTVERTLLLGRDPQGNRPLFYRTDDESIAFSSMPSGIHALPGVERAFSAETMAELLALFPQSGPGSVFRGILKVPSGHVVRCRDGRIEVTRYWRPTGAQIARTREEAEQGLRDVLDRAVKARARRLGGPLSCQLSGGLDSSIVASAAATQIAPDELVAVTAVPRAGFDGPVPDAANADEGILAARLAALHPNMRHVLVPPGDESYCDLLDRQLAFTQEPTANPCNSAWGRGTYCAAAAAGSTVMLVGFAGNLTISYAGFELLPALIRSGRLAKAWRLARSVAGKGVPWRTLIALGLGPWAPDWMWRQACRMYGRPTELSGYTAVSRSREAELKQRAAETGFDFLYRASADPFEVRRAALTDGDNGCYYKGVLAEFGLCLRDPTSDRRVMEYCFSVAPEEFIRNGMPRSLARRAFGDRLPAEIRDTLQRGYQAADWHESVAAQMADLRAEYEAIRRCGLASEAMDVEWLGETLDSWPSDADWAARGVALRYRHGLLRGIAAGHFMRKVSGTN